MGASVAGDPRPLDGGEQGSRRLRQAKQGNEGRGRKSSDTGKQTNWGPGALSADYLRFEVIVNLTFRV